VNSETSSLSRATNRQGVMSRFTKCLATALIVNAVPVLTVPTEAASPSKADKAALKRAIVACKAEAKGKKDQVSLAPEIRQQLRRGDDEGPSEHGHHNFAQGASGFDGSSRRALARGLDG